MTDNEQDTNKPAPGVQKASTPGSSIGSKLPPVEATLKNQFAQVAPTLKGSFQLDEKDKAKLPNKKWIHLALIVIPLGLLVSLVILLWAFFLNRGESSNVEDQSTVAEESTESASTLPPLPTIDDRSDAPDLIQYLASVSSHWKDEYVQKVPESAAAAYEDYLDSSDEDKRNQAVDFYTYLNNPGVEKTDENFILFLNDVRLDLEKQVGGPLYY